MAPRPNRTLTQRIVDRLVVDDKDPVFWVRELPEFRLRVHPSGTKVYVVQTREPDGLKRAAVGRHSVITTDEARRRAAPMFARIKAGEAPGSADASGS